MASEKPPEEGVYMEKNYQRVLSDKEVWKVLNDVQQARSQVWAVGWNENLQYASYFRVITKDEGTTYLIKSVGGKFQGREETEAYREWRLYATPLPE